MGPDQVSGWMLKNCAEELSWPICELYKKSLEEGYVPEKWNEVVGEDSGEKVER